MKSEYYLITNIKTKLAELWLTTNGNWFQWRSSYNKKSDYYKIAKKLDKTFKDGPHFWNCGQLPKTHKILVKLDL